MEFQCFLQIGESFLFGLALAGHIDLQALGDVPLPLTPDCRREWSLHNLIVSHGEGGFGLSLYVAQSFGGVQMGRLRKPEDRDHGERSKAYTRPWTVVAKQVAVLDTDLLDAICLENEKDLAHLPGK